MSARRISLALAASLAAGALVAGCGSSGDSSTTTTASTAISKTAFVTQANAICDKGNQAQGAAESKLGKNPTQAQVTALVSNTLVPNIQGQIDGIKALGAPAGDEATVAKLISLAQADLNKLKADPSQISNDKLFANFAAVAHPYGLTVCAKGD
jgi:hypothetical protein